MKTGKNYAPKFTLSIFLILILLLLTYVSCGKDKTEDPACTEQEWFEDLDQDGEGNSASSVNACDRPDNYVGNSLDPDDSNGNITSDCTTVTYYLDSDGDNYGNPNSETIVQCSGLDAPTDYVVNNTDCDDTDEEMNQDEITAYKDADGDDYGNPDESITTTTCNIPENYVLNNNDCDDTNNSIHPNADGDDPYDGVDTDCDGTHENPPTIWNGPNVNFSKAANADWTLSENQDQLTEKVSLTRQNNNVYLYNYQWWQDNFGEDAEHLVGQSDLAWDFHGNAVTSVKDMGNIQPTGGVKDVRWTLLDATGADDPNDSWDNFPFYGTLGDPTHFYSFHNLASIVKRLNQDFAVVGVKDDFEIIYNISTYSAETEISEIVGKRLGVWLVEENIYFTMTFNSWSDNGGAFSYTRSTPNNNN